MKIKLSILFLFAIGTCLNAQWDIAFTWDTISFEEATPYPYLNIDTSSQNIWQIGTPQKTVFTEAYSLPNAIMTDTLLPYPINAQSYVELAIGTFNFLEDYPYNFTITFEHQYDTDTLCDGGYITISYDNRATWTNIINDSLYQQVVGGDITPSTLGHPNLYTNEDLLCSGEVGFSGSSNEWKHTTLSWVLLPVVGIESVYPDTIFLRFNFESDSLDTAKDGWMIDNIQLHSLDVGSSIKPLPSSLTSIYPNPTKDGHLHLLMDPSLQLEQLAVFNIQGQFLFSQTDPIIKLSEKGIYIVHIKTEQGILVKKVVYH